MEIVSVNEVSEAMELYTKQLEEKAERRKKKQEVEDEELGKSKRSWGATMKMTTKLTRMSTE